MTDRSVTTIRPERELFTDEWGTFWVPAEGRTAEDAVKAVEAADGPLDGAYDPPELVRGHVETRDGEPWFVENAEGGFECWRVAAY